MPWTPSHNYLIRKHLGIPPSDTAELQAHLDTINDELLIADIDKALNELESLETSIGATSTAGEIIELVGDIKFAPTGKASGMRRRRGELRYFLEVMLGVRASATPRQATLYRG